MHKIDKYLPKGEDLDFLFCFSPAVSLEVKLAYSAGGSRGDSSDLCCCLFPCESLYGMFSWVIFNVGYFVGDH